MISNYRMKISGKLMVKFAGDYRELRIDICSALGESSPVKLTMPRLSANIYGIGNYEITFNL